MAKKAEKIEKISVRLDAEAVQKLNEAVDKGFTKSQYINKIIKDSTAVDNDINLGRAIVISINKIQSQLEFEEDTEMKKNIREELNEICHVLKSSQNHI